MKIDTEKLKTNINQKFEEECNHIMSTMPDDWNRFLKINKLKDIMMLQLTQIEKVENIVKQLEKLNGN